MGRVNWSGVVSRLHSGCQILAVIILTIQPARAETSSRFLYLSTDTDMDARHMFTHDVLQLALEKTRQDYGDYTLDPMVPQLNRARLYREIQRGAYENLFIRVSADDRMLDDFTLVPFPTALGADSYRVAFIRQSAELDPRRSCDLDPEHIRQLSVVQGIGWLDSEILSANGFTVIEISDYPSMFELVAVGRVATFYRSLYEINLEQRIPLVAREELVADPCWSVYYPLPRFLMTDKGNTRNADRILTGLQRAYQDGSYLQMWERYYRKAVESARLSQRKYIVLENPYLRQFDTDYLKYHEAVAHYFEGTNGEAYVTAHNE